MITVNWKTIAAGGVVAVGLYLFAKREVTQAARDVGAAINPVNPENIFYRGTNSIVQALTGDDHQSFGGWLYDVLHDKSPEAGPVVDQSNAWKPGASGANY